MVLFVHHQSQSAYFVTPLLTQHLISLALSTTALDQPPSPLYFEGGGRSHCFELMCGIFFLKKKVRKIKSIKKKGRNSSMSRWERGRYRCYLYNLFPFIGCQRRMTVFCLSGALRLLSLRLFSTSLLPAL